MTINGQIHRIVDMHIAADCAGDQGKLLERLRPVDRIVTGDRVDSEGCIRLKINLQILIRLPILSIVSRINTCDMRGNMRIGDEVAGRDIQFIALRAVMFR